MRVLTSLLILLLIVSSCKDESSIAKSSDVEFRFYNLEKAGWKSRVEKQKIDSITFKATLVPIQYYILKEKGRDNLEMIDSLYEIHKRERVIEFIFEDDSEQDLLQSKFTNLDYQKSVEYMSFNIAKDFYIITSSNDTIPCSGVVHERNYKITPYTKVMLFFADVNPEDKIQLVYNDALYRKGNVKLRFSDPILNL